eukprot:51181-Rhodomonas_salina.1
MQGVPQAAGIDGHQGNHLADLVSLAAFGREHEGFAEDHARQRASDLVVGADEAGDPLLADDHASHLRQPDGDGNHDAIDTDDREVILRCQQSVVTAARAPLDARDELLQEQRADKVECESNEAKERSLEEVEAEHCHERLPQLRVFRSLVRLTLPCLQQLIPPHVGALLWRKRTKLLLCDASRVGAGQRLVDPRKQCYGGPGGLLTRNLALFARVLVVFRHPSVRVRVLGNGGGLQKASTT